MKNWHKLVVSILIPQVVAGVVAYFTVTGNGSWYQSIEKPAWNPPNWLFGPVWITLYIMMGIAFYLIWKSGNEGFQKKKAMGLWMAQLVLNFFWTIIFFGNEQILGAFLEILILWILILLTIFAFAKIDKRAAWLLVPYISWVSFAAMLNFAIWELNR
jgi:tryptophan-rich sensory protein